MSLLQCCLSKPSPSPSHVAPPTPPPNQTKLNQTKPNQGTSAAPSALATTTAPCEGCLSVNLTLSAPALVDRFLIKEELRTGQLVMNFTVLVDGAPVFEGTSIGRTLIARLKAPVQATRTVELRVNEARVSAFLGAVSD